MSETQEAIYEVNNLDPDFCVGDLVLLMKNLEKEICESHIIQHVPKDGNAVATALSNSMLDGDSGMTEYGDSLLLRFDRAHFYC